MTDDVTLLKEIDEYLSGHPQNAIWAGSKLHQSVRSHLRAPRVEDVDLRNAILDEIAAHEAAAELAADRAAVHKARAEALRTTLSRRQPSQGISKQEREALLAGADRCYIRAEQLLESYNATHPGIAQFNGYAATLRSLADRLAGEDGAAVGEKP